MDIVAYNLSWMSFNIALALLPVIFMMLFFSVRNKPLKGLFFILWFLFFPNTFYVVTDIEHIIRQWPQIPGIEEQIIVFIQYSILVVVGLAAFLIALYPFEKLFQKHTSKELTISLLVVYNFLLGFALVLGKVERIHSIDVFLDPLKVFTSAIRMLQSGELIMLALFFGVFANCFYFLIRNRLPRSLTLTPRNKRKS